MQLPHPALPNPHAANEALSPQPADSTGTAIANLS